MKHLTRYFVLLITAACISISISTWIYFLSSNSIQGKYIKWTHLESPPEKAEKILAPYYIQTTLGNYYHYSEIPCHKNCWEQINEGEIKQEPSSTFPDCGWYPNTGEYINTLEVCTYFYAQTWAIDKQGDVWLWEKKISENDGISVVVLTVFSFFVCFILCGFIIVVLIVREGWKGMFQGKKSR